MKSKRNRYLTIIFVLVVGLLFGVYQRNDVKLETTKEETVITKTDFLDTNVKTDSKSLVRNDNKSYDIVKLSNSSGKKEWIGGYRYPMSDYIADGGVQNYPCATAIWIDYCNEVNGTKYCYYIDPSTGKERKVYRMRLAGTQEAASATCKNTISASFKDVVEYSERLQYSTLKEAVSGTVSGELMKSSIGSLTKKSDEIYADRYVGIDGDSKYDCGDKLYITTCNSFTCSYTKVNGKSSSGQVTRLYLKSTAAIAKDACSKNDFGYRYVAKDGKNYSCADKLYITSCTDTECKFTKVNGKDVKGTVVRNDLRGNAATAEKDCGVKGNRYVQVSNKDFNCGDELYITSCTEGMCDYNRKNGNSEKGTVIRNHLTDDASSAKKNCTQDKNEFGVRYASTKSYDYNCGDELYITTCDDDYCEYTKVNGKKASGNIERYTLKGDKSAAEAACKKQTHFGNRYVHVAGKGYNCGDKLYITECDDKVCVYSSVNDVEASGTVLRNNLGITKSGAQDACKQNSTVDTVSSDIGIMFAIEDGASFKCGEEMYVTSCDERSCTYTMLDGYNANGTAPINKLTSDKSVAETACGQTTGLGYAYVSVNGENYNCGDALYITSCSGNDCNYTKVKDINGTEELADGTVNLDLLFPDKSSSDAVCEATIVTEEQKECNNEKKEEMIGDSAYTMCYEEEATVEEVKEEIQETYICDKAKGYEMDMTSLSAVGEETCNDEGICSMTYQISCTRGKVAKPTVNVTAGIAGSDGYGTITVEAVANEGTLESYYVSEVYSTPSDSNIWLPITSNKFTINSLPGVKYIWVKDSKGNISNAVTSAVLDSDTVNTTIKSMQLKDANGKDVVAYAESYDNNTVKSSKYVRLSNNLAKDSKVVADAFNPYDMEYKLEVSSPTVSVYATLTSTDSSYVTGYEPRTVNLDYGVNTILIKIKNNEGKVRTYTILATRTDDRTSDNTLKELTVSEGSLTFNANVTDYKVEISKSTKSVDVKASIGSDKASYVEGYEPGNVKITGDTTVKLIKVKSETGSTRTYVITFVKKGTDLITDESLQLMDLTIPGVYMAFEETVANYSVSAEYETEIINLNAVLKDENSSIVYRSKRKSSKQYSEISNKGIALDVGENFIEIEVTNTTGKKSYYRLTIIRKEFGLGISNDTTLKDLKVMGYDIKFNPKEKDYVVRIKQEKSLVIAAVPNSNRAEVFIRGNDELTGFSTVRVKVVAENGEFETYSIDIKKAAFNKVVEIGAIIVGVAGMAIASVIIVKKKKSKSNREYIDE